MATHMRYGTKLKVLSYWNLNGGNDYYNIDDFNLKYYHIGI